MINPDIKVPDSMQIVCSILSYIRAVEWGIMYEISSLKMLKFKPMNVKL